MRRPLTILYLIETTDPGGAEIALVNLASGLDRQHFQPLVGMLKEGWLAEQVRRREVPVCFLQAGGRGLVDWRLVWNLRRLMRRQRVDVVHSFLLFMNCYGAVAAWLARRPMIAGVRGTSSDLASSRQVLAYRLACRLASRVTVVSEDLGRSVASVLGVPASKMLITPNGVDSERFRPDEEVRAAARQELGIPPQALLVGTVGRLEAVKAQADLVRAVAELSERLPDLHLLILGEGSERGALESLAREAGLATRVHLPGFREEVERVLPALDVFVLPSLSEGMPNALLQAMAAGLPAVASDVGGNPEVLRVGETGLLVPAGDCYELARAIERLLTNRELAAKMGAAGRARVQREYSQVAFIRRHERLYRELAHGG